MTPSNNCLSIIKHYEGCRLAAYQDSVGVWTIGVGHTHNVQQGQTITQATADLFLNQDLANTVNNINSLHLSINQNEFDAIISFTFNEGIGNFEHSKIYTATKGGQLAVADADFTNWELAGGRHLNGLAARRQTEALLYKTGELKYFNLL
jgi:lysozyme